jgi:hypothetical protein
MGVSGVETFLILFSVLSLVGFSINFDSHAMELDCDQFYEFRSINGACNNFENPLYGSAGIELLRNSTDAYEDGISLPSGYDRPNPRLISNILANQTVSIPNQDGASDFIWQWGQFLDHDIDLTGSAMPKEYFNVTVPAGDPYFDPNSTGTQVIPLTRSIYDENSPPNPRQQINQITAYIDASNVYGSNDIFAESLRDEKNPAKLKTSKGNLLPESGGFFVAGDVRANEQIGLTAMHTLFVREHNRLADEIAHKNPDYSDEQVYQIARKIVGAKIQFITYNEFLPKLLGPESIPQWEEYDPTINPGISNEFSTASYRYGHSQLSPNLMILDNSYMEYVPLRDAFFNPTLFKEKGLDPILRGLASQKAQEIDNKVVDDVRNFLFGPPGSGGFDLASLNIQRGRDHGLADYNTVRVAYGLENKTSFTAITEDPYLQNKLATTYTNGTNTIDLWVGGLAEDHVQGAMVGETIRTILIDQFTRLQNGDRFWYQNDLFFQDPEYLNEIESTTLSQIIKQNTNLNDSKIPEDVFECQYMKGGGHDKKHGDFITCE